MPSTGPSQAASARSARRRRSRPARSGISARGAVPARRAEAVADGRASKPPSKSTHPASAGRSSLESPAALATGASCFPVRRLRRDHSILNLGGAFAALEARTRPTPEQAQQAQPKKWNAPRSPGRTVLRSVTAGWRLPGWDFLIFAMERGVEIAHERFVNVLHRRLDSEFQQA